MPKILILEPGAWGTVLGIILSKKNEVRFWYKNPRLSFKIERTRENKRLAGIKIPKKIFVSSNLENLVRDTELIIVASPSFNFRQTLFELKKLKKLPILLGIAKGLEKETLKFPSQIVEELFGETPYAHLSGPGFAKEIIQGKRAKEVIASKDRTLLKKLETLFKIKPLKPLITTDLMGVQLAGALKNTFSIGISLVEAGCGNPEMFSVKENLIKKSLEEMIKIGKVFGAKKETFLGPAGLGDLILTSGSPLSRNFQFGQAIFNDADKLRKEIQEKKITVEGFNSAFAFYQLGKIHQLDLPMIREIYKVIFKKVSPSKTIKNLIKLTKLEACENPACR